MEARFNPKTESMEVTTALHFPEGKCTVPNNELP